MKQDGTRPAGAPLSKPEAVWRAIEELGYRADVTQILDYVRTKYGIGADSPEPAEAPAAPPEPAAKPAGQRKPRPRGDG